MDEREQLITRLADFIRSTGLTVEFGDLGGPTVLPGIHLRQGTMVIDRRRLDYPGDLLHEAGHLAVMPPSVRKTMDDRLESTGLQQAGEIMAFAWSYAACLYLEIDPHIVFHDNGYQGSGGHVAREFMQGRYVGVPLMEWYGLTYTEASAEAVGEKPFPHMQQWVCTIEKS